MTTYTYPKKPICGDLLASELRDLGLPIIGSGPPEIGVSVSEVIDLTFVRALSVAEQDAVAGALDDHAQPPPLTEAVAARSSAARVADSSDPQAVLLRAVMRVVMQSVKECRDRLSLPSRTWAQLQAAVRQQIDSGGGDAS